MNAILKNKHILVTGVSRPGGIGAGIVKTLAESGAQVSIHGFAQYDQNVSYPDSSLSFIESFALEMREQGYNVVAVTDCDLSIEENVTSLIEKTVALSGSLDGIVLNHAYSTHAELGMWNMNHINMHLQVNVTATMMLIQEFARLLPEGKRGAITLFTSGQFLGSMPTEIAYAVSKDAIIGITKQTARVLSDKNIQVNCINPGPTDTGYANDAGYQKVVDLMPQRRWGKPEDAARLVRFLQSDDSIWITGEVISSEGGFKR